MPDRINNPLCSRDQTLRLVQYLVGQLTRLELRSVDVEEILRVLKHDELNIVRKGDGSNWSGGCCRLDKLRTRLKVEDGKPLMDIETKGTARIESLHVHLLDRKTHVK